MDPLSAIAGISGICATGAKIMFNLYKYVEEVRSVPQFIESLLSELSAISSSLQNLNDLITRRGESRREFVIQWAEDSRTVLEKCNRTFEEIDLIIQNSKTIEKTSANGQIVKYIRWTWKKDDIEIARKRLEGYRTTIWLMLQTLDSQQIDNINDLVELIHKSLSETQENRKFVKQVLEVMDNGHPRFNSANFTLTYNPVQHSEPLRPGSSIGTQTVEESDLSVGTQTLPRDGSVLSIDDELTHTTSLHWASRRGCDAAAPLLLDKRVVIEEKSNKGMTAPSRAVMDRHEAEVQLLPEARAILDNRGRGYEKAVQRAAESGNEKLVQLLVEKWGDINVQSDEYRDVLQLGCIKGHAAVVDYLLRAGANPNKADEHGWTPVICALLSGQKDVLGRLLAAGGDLSLVPHSTVIQPTLWSMVDKSELLSLDESRTGVRYVDTGDGGVIKPAAVRANHPIPLHNSSFYFEIIILNSGESGDIGLGLCSGYVSLNAVTGLEFSSWSYHKDGSKLYTQSGTGITYSDKFETGDLVGCHIDFDKGITFTKNGVSLGLATSGMHSKLFPVVGMKSRGAHIQAKFGLEYFPS